MSFGLSAGITSVLVPLVRSLGLHFGFTDKPDPRKQHSTPMVRLGGVAMVFGFGLALTAVWLFGGFGLLAPARDQLIWSTLAGSLCFFFIGLADDLFALSPWPRLAGQVAVSCVIWSEGVRIGAIDLPWFSSTGSAIVLSDGFSLLATVIWLVGNHQCDQLAGWTRRSCGRSCRDRSRRPGLGEFFTASGGRRVPRCGTSGMLSRISAP